MTAVLGAAALVGALIATGVMAGLYAAFAIAVMPGLARIGDLAFADAMHQINRAIRNGWFAAAFAGAAVLTGLAAVPHAGSPALPWIATAFLLYGATLVITFGGNVPLNDALDAAVADPAIRTDPARAAAARAAFEARWVRRHAWRTLLCLAAFACLAIALLVRG